MDYQMKTFSLIKSIASLAFFFFLFLECSSALEWNVISHETVIVKPGAGLQALEAIAGDHKCTFYYKTQGGTKEDWDFEMKKSSPAGSWRCSLKRPSASYLFFEEFMFELDSGYLHAVEMEARPGIKLAENEYTIDHENRKVRNVHGAFKSQLNSVEVEFSQTPPKQQRPQREL